MYCDVILLKKNCERTNVIIILLSSGLEFLV